MRYVQMWEALGKGAMWGCSKQGGVEWVIGTPCAKQAGREKVGADVERQTSCSLGTHAEQKTQHPNVNKWSHHDASITNLGVGDRVEVVVVRVHVHTEIGQLQPRE